MFDFISVHWDKLSSPPEFAALVVILVAIGGAVYYLFIRKKDGLDEAQEKKIAENYKLAYDSQEARIKSLEIETKSCNDQHHQSLQLIGQLQGQIDTLKTIPLDRIYKGISSVERHINANTKALEALPSAMQEVADKSMESMTELIDKSK